MLIGRELYEESVDDRLFLRFSRGCSSGASPRLPSRRDKLRVMPDNPVGGEDFLLVFEGTVGWTPGDRRRIDHRSPAGQPDLLQHFRGRGAAPPAEPSDFRVVKALTLAPGTYQLTTRVFGSFSWYVIRTLTIPPPTTVTPQYRSLTGSGGSIRNPARL
jgi:hypothetical protein